MPSHFFNGLGKTVLEIFKSPVKATFTPQEGQPQSIEVIFVARHQDVDSLGREIGAPRPVAWHNTGLIEAKYKDEIEIEGSVYYITEIKYNGHETTELSLQWLKDAC